MNELAQKKCVPCEGGESPLDSAEIAEYMTKISSSWSVNSENTQISREFIFENFQQALGFVNRVGEIAEEENHHPDLNLHDYKKVTVSLTTHAIGGLSENDFILASKIDAEN